MKRRALSRELSAASSLYTREKHYWLKKMSGEPEKSIFPYDYPGHDSDSKRGESKFLLPDDLFTRIMKISRWYDYTIHIIMVTGIALLLERYNYTGISDIIIGTPIYKQEIEAEFVNKVLPLRIQIQENMTFKELLLQVKQTVVEAEEHQNFPIEKLLYLLGMKYKETDFPLFDVAVLLENIHDKSYLRQIPLGIIFSFTRAEEHIEAKIEYNKMLYREDMVQRIAGYFITLMRGVLFNPGSLLSTVDLLTPTGKRELLEMFNGPAPGVPGANTIDQWFEDTVSRCPDRTAVVYEGEHLTYNRLNHQALLLAAVLRARGVTSDSIVGLLVERSTWMITGIMGIIKAGAGYLPIEESYPPGRINYLVTESQSKVIVTSTSNRDRVISAKPVVIDREETYTAGMNDTWPANRPDSLAYVIYTSGSTGQPKGVAIEHRNVINLVYGLKQEIYQHYVFPLKVSLVASYVFDASVKQIFGAILLGNCLQVVPGNTRMEGTALIEFYRENAIDISDGTPTHIRMMLESQENAISSLNIKHFIIGGEVLPQNIVSRFFKRFEQDSPWISNVYGPTECCVDSTVYHVSKDKLAKTGNIPIGMPLVNQQVYILGTGNHLQPIGVPGELCIAGGSLARGYLNCPGSTAEKFVRHLFRPGTRLYRTGDLARLLSDGNIEFSGRLDHQAKIRGLRIEPAEIQHLLLEHPEIKDVVVMMRVNKENEKYLCVYFVSKKPQLISLLKDYLLKWFPDYMIPPKWMQLDKIPLTPGGKVDRKALPEPGPDRNEQYAPPGDQVERKLVKIWARLLGIKEDMMGIEDDFFESGGHSLKATILMSKIKKEFNIDLPLVKFFNNPIIKSLAENIRISRLKSFTAADDHLVLLKPAAANIETPVNLFLIHDGTGEIEGYIEFCKHLASNMNYLGIRARRLKNLAPRNITIEEMARNYQEKIKKIQTHGPYYIAAWSFGGVIAYELANLLEQEGEDIDFLGLIDAAPPGKIGQEQEETGQFHLESELDIISNYPDFPGLSALEEKLKDKSIHAADIGQLWSLAAGYLESVNYDVEKIKEAIIGYGMRALPNFHRLNIRESIYYLNIGRTFRRSRALYTPARKINTPVHFFAASQSKGIIDNQSWDGYCSKPIKYYEVAGDHYSIFSKPGVIDFAGIFTRAINRIIQSINGLTK